MRDYKYGDLYFDSQHDKQMKIDVVGTGIVIDNSMIEMEAFELDEALCSESELKFGRCEANSVKFTVHGMPRSIKGEKISISEEIDGNTDEPFRYGIYKVYSDVPSSDRTKREITAYDAMYDIINADVKSWYAGLSFPMTLKAFRNSFFSYLGVEQAETTLVNDGMTINKTLTSTQTDSESTITEESSISGKTVIEAICEINGVFGNINHDGEFEYVELEPIIKPLYPSNDLYPREDLFPRDPNTISMTGHYITFDYEDFKSKAITQLEIRPSDDSAGVTVGASGNNYVISGNFLVSDKTGAELEAIAENALSVIKKAAYIPIKSSEIVGNPCIELGDPIRFNTTREIVESYVLQRTLTGIQSKRDSITSNGTETHSAKVNSIKDTISNISGRTNKLERTAEHTLSEIKAVDSKVNELDSSVKESVSDLDSKIEQTASSITSEVNARVTQINNDISTVDEKVDDLSTSVGTSVTELSSKIWQTAENIKSEVTRATGAEATLQSSITQNAESISSEVVNRKNADSEMSTRIIQNSDKIQSEVSRATTAESNLSSQISQTSEQIALKVSKGDVSSQLSLESGQITITGDRLVIDATNYALTSDGDIFVKGYLFYRDGDYYDAVLEPDGRNRPILNVYGAVIDGDINVGGTINGTVSYASSSDYASSSGSASSASYATNAGSANNADYADKCGSYIYYTYFTGNGNFVPNSSGVYCGTGPNPFAGGYSVNGWKTTSDERLKKDFVSLADDKRFEVMFYLLNPIEYKLKADNDGIVHVGYGAQSVKEAMEQAGIQESEFFGISHEYVDLSQFETEEERQQFLERNCGNTDTYSLSYQEFIALNTHMIQNQHEEIESLKQENLALQNRLSILEQKMEVLYNVINNKNN